MPRAENKSTPKVESGYLYSDEESFPVDSPRWSQWLEQHSAFYYESPAGSFTARKEDRKGYAYWFAYRRKGHKLHNYYIGKSKDLTAARLVEVAQRLANLLPS